MVIMMFIAVVIIVNLTSFIYLTLYYWFRRSLLIRHVHNKLRVNQKCFKVVAWLPVQTQLVFGHLLI